MHNGPTPSRHRRGKNRTTSGPTPPNEDPSTLMSPDGRDLTNADSFSQPESEATYSDMHLVEFTPEETTSVVEL
jgi:hypothetical protein